MIAERNISVCGWNPFQKLSRSTSSPKQSVSMRSHDHRSISVHDERTTLKSNHDATTLRENLAEFIISDLLRIAIFAKYFSGLIFPPLWHIDICVIKRFHGI